MPWLGSSEVLSQGSNGSSATGRSITLRRSRRWNAALPPSMPAAKRKPSGCWNTAALHCRHFGQTEDLLQPDRFPVYQAGRGGQYTYHGPGQRIAYVMLDLARRQRDVRRFVGDLEQWMIAPWRCSASPESDATAGSASGSIAAAGAKTKSPRSASGCAIGSAFTGFLEYRSRSQPFHRYRALWAAPVRHHLARDLGLAPPGRKSTGCCGRLSVNSSAVRRSVTSDTKSAPTNSLHNLRTEYRQNYIL